MRQALKNPRLHLWLFCLGVWIFCWWMVWHVSHPLYPPPPAAPAVPRLAAAAGRGCVVVESGTDNGVEWRKVECK